MTRRGFLFGGLCASMSGQSGWKAGIARATITPREPIWMAGYAARNKPSEGVRQDLYVKALALEDEAGRAGVLVTFDLIGITRPMSDAIAERVRKVHGIPRERLLLNASHTHSGPVTGQILRGTYNLDAHNRAVIDRYTAWLLDTAVEVIGKSLAGRAPATLDFGQGLAGFAVNRRRVTLRHLPGPVDHDVPVLAVRAPGGALRAVVFGYACHATALSDYQINGDWPGYAQESIESAHPGATALFVAGCGADANPLPRRTVELARTYGGVMAAAVDIVLGQKMARVGGRLAAAIETVDVAFAPAPSREEFARRAAEDRSEPVRRHARVMIERIEREGRLPATYPYTAQVWRIGPELTLIALAGEVVVDYALRFRARYGWDTTWVAGYSNDVFAYIPSERVLKEGGYEGGGAMIPYAQPGPFAPGIEEAIAATVDALVRRTLP